MDLSNKKCPICSSEDITGGEVNMDETFFCWQKVECDTCASTWDEIYQFQSRASIVDNSGGKEYNKYYVVTVPELYLTQARVHALNKYDAIEKALNGESEWMMETQTFETTIDSEQFEWKVEEE
jgi:hypothetical protein